MSLLLLLLVETDVLLHVLFSEKLAERSATPRMTRILSVGFYKGFGCSCINSDVSVVFVGQVFIEHVYEGQTTVRK